MDPSISELMSTARPEKLLKNDGSIVTQVVKSVAVPEPSMAKANRAFDTGTKVFNFKSFLSANAMRSTNSLDGLDDCSSNNSTTCAVQSIKVPIMVAAMGAYHFVRDQEIIYDKSASRDKDYIVVEGALHDYSPCRACETTPGQYSNTVKNLLDYIRVDQQAVLGRKGLENVMRLHALIAAFLCAAAPAAFAQTTWPNQKEADYIIKDFRFADGETIAELRMHYMTLGTPKRNAAGETSTASCCRLAQRFGKTGCFHLADELYAKGQPLDASGTFIIIPDASGSALEAGRRAEGQIPHYRYHDTVEAEHRVVTEALGIKHRLVMGSPWAACRPGCGARCIPI
jgi:hypothetical protein